MTLNSEPSFCLMRKACNVAPKPGKRAISVPVVSSVIVISSSSCCLTCRIEKLMFFGGYFLQSIEKPEYSMACGGECIAGDGEDGSRVYKGLSTEKSYPRIFRTKSLQVSRAIAGMRDIIHQAEVGQCQNGLPDRDQGAPSRRSHYQGKD